MPPVNYAVDYSVMRVKKMIERSELRPHPQNNAKAMGHASSLHQGVGDADLVARSGAKAGDASAFINKGPNSYLQKGMGGFDDAGDLVPNDFWAKVPINDQAYVISSILNTAFGQTALAMIQGSCRLTISALTIDLAFNMRGSTQGAQVVSPPIGRIIIVVEPAGMVDGYPELHFVTAYPVANTTTPKFGPLPGVVHKNFLLKKGSQNHYKWNSTNQNDPTKTFVFVP